MKSISVKDLVALGDATEIVDVREEDEYVAVRVPGARGRARFHGTVAVSAAG